MSYLTESSEKMDRVCLYIHIQIKITKLLILLQNTDIEILVKNTKNSELKVVTTNLVPCQMYIIYLAIRCQ